MNKGPAETAAFLKEFLTEAETLAAGCDVVVAAPFVSLPAAGALLVGSKVGLAAEALQTYLARISGAALPIRDESEAVDAGQVR